MWLEESGQSFFLVGRVVGNLNAVHVRNLLGTGEALVKSDGDGLAFTISSTRATARCAAGFLGYRCAGKAHAQSIGRHCRR